MKRAAAVLAMLLMLCVFSGCGRKMAELALITDTGAVTDRGVNQSAWEGLVKYADEKSISKQYYLPSEKTTDACFAAIEKAIKNGAKVVVASGNVFEEAVFLAQETYSDIAFILIDGEPHNADASQYRTTSNTTAVTFAEEQAGFLAGYAAVKEGMTNLGFIGGLPLASTVRYGYGFVQGAEYAAGQLGLAPGSVQMRYTYLNSVDQSPETQELAAGWYADGVQCILAGAGNANLSVMAAAEGAGGKVIGTDVDQSFESESVISSATKNLSQAVYETIAAYYDEEFPGGKKAMFDAANNGIELLMANAKFSYFTQKDYDAVYMALMENTNDLASNILKDTDAKGNGVQLSDLALAIVALKEM